MVITMCYATIDIYLRKHSKKIKVIDIMGYICKQNITIGYMIPAIKDRHVKIIIEPFFCVNYGYSVVERFTASMISYFKANMLAIHTFSIMLDGQPFSTRDRWHKCNNVLCNRYDQNNSIVKLLKKHNSNKKVLVNQKYTLNMLAEYDTKI